MNTPEKTIHEVQPNTFIFEKKHALPLDVCQEMIRRFEALEARVTRLEAKVA